jgi:hypothetical protein
MSNSDTRIRKSASQQEVARSDRSQIFIANPKGLDILSRPFTSWVVYKLKYSRSLAANFSTTVRYGVQVLGRIEAIPNPEFLL